MTVDFFKKKYGYEIDGVWMPRVTSITSSPQSQWRGLRKAAEWGTSVHEAIEALLRGEQTDIDGRMHITIETFLAWKQQYPIHIANPMRDIEQRVFDIEYGYAGTVDLIAEIDGIPGVLDFKTSTTIVREHALQTAAYMQAYNKQAGVEPCQTRWILRIDQFQECRGCFAKRRDKYGAPRVSGGKDVCNHQWTEVQGEIEFKELENMEKDFEAFLIRKEKWEWTNQEILQKIPNYEKNINQYALL